MLVLSCNFEFFLSSAPTAGQHSRVSTGHGALPSHQNPAFARKRRCIEVSECGDGAHRGIAACSVASHPRAPRGHSTARSGTVSRHPYRGSPGTAATRACLVAASTSCAILPRHNAGHVIVQGFGAVIQFPCLRALNRYQKLRYKIEVIHDKCVHAYIQNKHLPTSTHFRSMTPD